VTVTEEMVLDGDPAKVAVSIRRVVGNLPEMAAFCRIAGVLDTAVSVVIYWYGA
jgi:hypothetical protein